MSLDPTDLTQRGMTTDRTYQPISLGRRLREMDFGRFRLAEAQYEPGRVLAAHAHRFPAFTVVLDGAYELEIDGCEFECTPRGVYFELGDSLHRNRVGDRGMRSLIIEVRAEGEIPLPRGHCMSRDPEALALSREIVQEYNARDDAAALALEGSILELMASLRRRSVREAGKARPRWLRAVLDRLHDDPGRRPSLDDLSGATGVHPVHLARIFRRHEGCSIGEYVRRLRLERAARMIAETDAGLAHVALRTGFYDQAHLTRAFKKRFDVTPGAYRRRARE